MIASKLNDVTQKRRADAYNAFLTFVGERKLSPQIFASFLTKAFFDNDLSSSALATLRSDIVTTIKIEYSVDWSENDIVKRVISSATRLKRPQPKYSSMWDIAKLYNHFAQAPEPSKLRDLRAKASVLVRASLAARAKDVHRISRSSVKFTSSEVKFRFFAWKTQKDSEPRLSVQFSIKKWTKKIRRSALIRH